VLSVSHESLPSGSNKQTTDKSPIRSTASLIGDFINGIDPKRTLRSITEATSFEAV
jgi:hypothetical protein